VDKIAEFVGLDSLYYLSLEGMVEATGMKMDEVCLACYTGEYALQTQRRTQTKYCFENNVGLGATWALAAFLMSSQLPSAASASVSA